MSNEMLQFLQKNNFENRLKHLKKKLKGKTVVIYGAGLLFSAIKENYDLSGLNIIAISDQKFKDTDQTDFLGYKVCAPADIAQIKPDYVLVSVIRTLDLIEYLRYVLLENEPIKIQPFVKKNFWETMKEIWM